MRVVRHAHAVAAQFLELEQPAQPGVGGCGGAEAADIVMEAHALEGARLAVDEEALVCVEAEGADTDDFLVAGAALYAARGPAQRRGEAIEMGLRVGPEFGLRHLAG